MDHSDSADTVEVVGLGRLRIRIALRHQRQQPVAAHDIVDESNRARLCHGERKRRQREHDGVPKWQDGERIGNGEIRSAATGLDGYHRAPALLASVMRSRPRS